MPKIMIRGVKTYRSKGRVYHYHRATGIRIEFDIDAAPQAFLARVQELDATVVDLAKPALQDRRHATLGDLFDAWLRSEEWATLKMQTRQTYERVVDPKKGALAPVRPRPLNEFTSPFIVGLRDAVKKRKKRWMANYAVKVLRLAFAWGRVHGWCQHNPAQGIPLLPRPVDSPERNRAWAPEEFKIVWDNASPALRRALALAHYAGMRIGDVVSVAWSAWDGETLSFRQSKTGQTVHVRAPRPLNQELNAANRESTQIVVNEKKQPYSRDGLQSILWKLVKRLESQGLVQAGLCFHGLRHSLGAALYDLGLDREARKAALGHSSDAASMVYERGGDRRAASDRAYAALDVHLSALASKAKNAK
jgi:integrase